MKKICFVLISIALLACCKKENGEPTEPKATLISVSPTTLLFEAISAEPQTVTVYADGSWTTQAPEWVVLNPSNGGSGEVKVEISVNDNTSKDGRIGDVVFGPELTTSITNRVAVQQKGDNKIRISTGQELADWLKTLSAESLDEATLENDIDMSGVTFESAIAFAGDFNGNGHAIKNLTATRPLFTINKGSIENVVIDATCSFEPDTTVFGTIVSRNEGKISGCTNKANVTRSIKNNRSDKRSNLIAGIVGMSTQTDTILNCKNYGNIYIIDVDNNRFYSQGVAGIVALTAGSVGECENHGDIKLEGGFHDKRSCPARTKDGVPNPDGDIASGEIYTTKVGASVGGVVAYVAGNLYNCTNKGNVSWIENNVGAIEDSPARMFAGGVAGNYYGNVTDCTNEGVFTVKAVSSDGADVTSKNHQLAAGGVCGACNNPANDSPSKNRGTDVRNCVNKGKVVVNANTSKSQMHIGGVVGWPNGDNDQCKGTMYDCSNTGDIEISGTALFRAGGVAGVSPNMEGCSNNNTITINGGHSDSCVGGLLGAHWGAKQTIKNCTVNVTVTSSATIDVSALTGDITGNDSNTQATFEGCSIKGSLSQTGGNVGMLVGWCKGTTKVSMGTSTAPLEISGSVNGTTLTSESPVSLLWGTGYDESIHTLNYNVK